VIGAAIIVVGLYSLIWGKSKDHKDNKQAGATVAELPLSMAAADANGNGNHVLNGAHVVVADVETPSASVFTDQRAPSPHQCTVPLSTSVCTACL
jgi:hypothetical protein